MKEGAESKVESTLQTFNFMTVDIYCLILYTFIKES